MAGTAKTEDNKYTTFAKELYRLNVQHQAPIAAAVSDRHPAVLFLIKDIPGAVEFLADLQKTSWLCGATCAGAACERTLRTLIKKIVKEEEEVEEVSGE